MNSKTDDSRLWLVIYTKPQTEKNVAKRLSKLGIEIYCPTYTTIRTWSDRKKKIELPLIRSYVFVRPKPNENLTILNDPHVLRFVYWNGKPISVKTEEIEAMQNLTEITTSLALQVGSEITIEQGHFQGQVAEVISVKRNKTTLYLPSLNMKIIVQSKDFV
jgi:transcription antitermination factor NusG